MATQIRCSQYNLQSQLTIFFSSLQSVECLFTNTAYLEIGFRSEALSPGEKVEIPISFYPREAISYHEIVTFEINGILQRTVELFGKGIEMKVRLGRLLEEKGDRGWDLGFTTCCSGCCFCGRGVSAPPAWLLLQLSEVWIESKELGF